MGYVLWYIYVEALVKLFFRLYIFLILKQYKK